MDLLAHARGMPALPPNSEGAATPARRPGAAGPDSRDLRRARRMCTSGRAVALWVAAFYALCLVAAAQGLNYWRPTSDSTDAVKLARLGRLVASEPDRPLLVMLGSSRTDAMFQARRFNGLKGPNGRPWLAYNFGVPGIGLMHELLFLREMLDAGIRPALLLAEVQTPLLNEHKPGFASEEGFLTPGSKSLAQMAALVPYLVNPGPKCMDWLRARLVPAYHYRFWALGAVQAWLSPERRPSWEECYDAWGYHLPDWPGAAECARRLEHQRRRFAYGLGQFKLGNGPCRALRDLLNLSHREHIPVVLVVPPESNTFRGWYSAEGLASLHDLVLDLRKDYGVPVLDASRWVEDRDFQDGHHVMAAGAEAFSCRLLEELEPYLALPGSPSRHELRSAYPASASRADPH